jgi:hypothetical protein
MTVATQTKKVTATGNGSATTFSFSPVVMTKVGDIVVTTTVIATGVETVRTEGTGSTNWSTTIVAGDYPTTGSIVYPADTVTPLASTHTITVSRLLTLEQQTDLENQGGYFPETHEQQYDKFVMIDLQQQEVIDRTLAFPLTYAGSVVAEVPAPLNANYYLRVNVAGDALEWTAVSSATASASDVTPLAGAITGVAGTDANFARDDHVHPQTHIKGSNLTSAAELTINTDGRYFDVAGSTGPITSMAVAVNRKFTLQFNSTPTLTHHASNLDLPGGANIVAAAGDVAEFFSTATDKVQCLSYTRAAGTVDSLAQGKHTIWVSAEAMRPAATNGCSTLQNVETTALRPDMNVLDFATGADDHAQFSVAFPKNWNASTVTFRAFWTSTATDTDGVAIGLQGVSVADNVTIDAVYGTAVVVTDDAQSAAEECYVTAESGAVTISNAADDAITFFQVFRDVSDANDDMTEDMRLLGIQLFYTSNAKDDT